MEWRSGHLMEPALCFNRTVKVPTVHTTFTLNRQTAREKSNCWSHPRKRKSQATGRLTAVSSFIEVSTQRPTMIYGPCHSMETGNHSQCFKLPSRNAMGNFLQMEN